MATPRLRRVLPRTWKFLWCRYTAPKTVVIRTAAGAEDWFADSNARYG